MDNWSSFAGKAGLLVQDFIHPTWEAAALISCTISLNRKTALGNL